MLGILRTTLPYRLLALAHILAVVVAFGPVLMYPTLRKARQGASIASLHMRMTLPALIALWVLGMGLAGMSDDAYKMSQTWLALSLVNWAILVGVSWFLIRPSLGSDDESANAKLAAGTGVTHLGLVVGLALMIWKPGR